MLVRIGDDDEGPNLGKRGTREWLVGLIQDAGHGRYFGERNEMPRFRDKLSRQDIEALADYLIALRVAK